MKGIVFNLLEETVADEFGEGTWDGLLQSSNLNGSYTSLGSYPDEQLVGLVGAASDSLKLPPDEILRWFGKAAVPLRFKRYPSLFNAHRRTKSFLLTLNDIIHPEVRKLYPGADVPEFEFEELSKDTIAMGYSSRRKFCAFAEGLIEGAANHFGDSVMIRQSQCMSRGDSKCVLISKFHTLEALPA